MTNFNIAKNATNNVINKDMITILNYIDNLLCMIAGQTSTISKPKRIMIALYLFGDMSTQEIAEKMCLSATDVASKSSQLRKKRLITKHGVFSHLTDESQAEIEELEETIKHNIKCLPQNDLILLYNSLLLFIQPFIELEDRPSLLYLLALATSIYEKLCLTLFGGKGAYGRASFLYYAEVFDVMDYAKYSHLLAKSIQNVQVLSSRLQDEGYININKLKKRQKLPDITITENGRKRLDDFIKKSNKGTFMLMLKMDKVYRNDFINSLTVISKIAIKSMRNDIKEYLV